MANQFSPELDGLVSVQNGQLQVQDPKPGGKPAVVIPDSTVRMFVNETQIFEHTPLTATTHVRISLPLHIIPDFTFDLDIEDKAMSAWLTVHLLQPGYLFYLPDRPPSPALKVGAEKRKVSLTAFDDVRTTILTSLKNKGVVFGLLPERLERALNEPGQRIRIAEGQQPLTRHDAFEYQFQLPSFDPDVMWLKQDAPPLPFLQECKPGNLLVRKIPGEAVRPGKDLFGQAIPPVPPERRQMVAADATVYLQNHGAEAISHFEGISSFNGRDVRVMALHKFAEDYDGHKSGSLDLKGSILINGSVRAHSHIWSTQNIEIMGDVEHAQMEAEENLIVHGHVVRSELSTGGDGAASLKLRPMVSQLLEQLQTVSSVYQTLWDTVPNIRSYPAKVVIMNLIKTQYSHIISDANRLWVFNKSLKQLHPRKTMVLKVVLSNLLNMDEKEFDEKSFDSWIAKVEEFLLDLNNLERTPNHLFLSYVQGSTLTANGDIYVCGEGCYNSHLVSNQNVLIIGQPGYFREGSLQVNGHLLVKELGSPNGSAVSVQLAPESELKASLIYPGVTLMFGSEIKLHLMEPLQHVRIYLKESKIITEPLYPVV